MITPKPRVLAIVDNSYWAIGTTGKLLVRNLSDEFDFFFIPEFVFGRRPDILRELLLACDAVLCLNESGAQLLKERAPVSLPPVITWIHHITTWNNEHQTAAEISDVVLACTPLWKKEIATYCAPGVRIEVVRNGTDPEYFYHRDVDRRKYGIGADRFVIGFFAHRGADKDAGRKGIDTLLAVLKRAAAEIHKLSLVMLGPGWDDLAADLQATGASAHVLGFVPRSEVPELYSLLDVYLLTSRVEGGPLPVLESMACGTPVVATRVGLVPDVIEDGVNGFSVEIGDVEAIVNSLRVLAADVALRTRMKSAARAAAEQHAAIHTHQPLRPILRSLIKQPLKAVTYPGSDWISDPVRTSRVSCAAECMFRVIVDVRKKRTTVGRAFRMVRDMLEGVSATDRIEAFRMMMGYSHRVNKVLVATGITESPPGA